MGNDRNSANLLMTNPLKKIYLFHDNAKITTEAGE